MVACSYPYASQVSKIMRDPHNISFDRPQERSIYLRLINAHSRYTHISCSKKKGKLSNGEHPFSVTFMGILNPINRTILIKEQVINSHLTKKNRASLFIITHFLSLR